MEPTTATRGKGHEMKNCTIDLTGRKASELLGISNLLEENGYDPRDEIMDELTHYVWTNGETLFARALFEGDKKEEKFLRELFQDEPLNGNPDFFTAQEAIYAWRIQNPKANEALEWYAREAERYSDNLYATGQFSAAAEMVAAILPDICSERVTGNEKIRAIYMAYGMGW